MTPKSLSLSDVVMEWIITFLNVWAVKVEIGSEISGNIAVRNCVPQGSVTGPQLFLLLVNALLDALDTVACTEY